MDDIGKDETGNVTADDKEYKVGKPSKPSLDAADVACVHLRGFAARQDHLDGYFYSLSLLVVLLEIFFEETCSPEATVSRQMGQVIS